MESTFLQRVAAELPKGWALDFGVEGGEMTISLADWDGDWCEEKFAGTPEEQVLAALEYAKVRGAMGLVGPMERTEKYRAARL